MKTVPEPDATKPPEPTFEGCLGACLCSLILIVGGIWYWNHWRSGIEEEAKKKVDRWLNSVRREQERIRDQIPPQPLFEQQKRIGEQLQWLEELRKSKSRR
jgi:hypothetical protein